MKMEIYQVIVPVISLIGIALTVRQYKKGNNTLFETAMWICLWLFIATVAIFPNKTTLFLSRTIGIKDHINAIIFIGLAISFFLNFRMFNALKRMNGQITELVRKIAIDNEVKNQNKA
jgi:hypothetical protein